MPLAPRVLMMVLLTAVALSGCLGGDDAPKAATDDPSAAPPAPTADTGSIKGQVVSEDLDPVVAASVAAIGPDGALAADTKTDAKGDFTFNGLTPGKYQVQVASVLFHAAIQVVDVRADAVTPANFKLERLDANDLQVPYQDYLEWQGFMSCGIGTPYVTTAACAFLDDTPAEDPNMDFLRRFNVTEGLRTIVVGVTWAPVGGATGTDLWVNVEDNGCGLSCPNSRTYASANQGPDIVLRIDQGPSATLSFDNISAEEERVIQVRVFPGGTANVMYQQPFTVHWHTFYWQPAPEDFNPFPDV